MLMGRIIVDGTHKLEKNPIKIFQKFSFFKTLKSTKDSSKIWKCWLKIAQNAEILMNIDIKNSWKSIKTLIKTYFYWLQAISGSQKYCYQSIKFHSIIIMFMKKPFLYCYCLLTAHNLSLGISRRQIPKSCFSPWHRFPRSGTTSTL